MEARIIRTCRLFWFGVAALAYAVPAQADTPRTPDLTAYVQARAADADGDAGFAAQNYQKALSAVPDSAVVATRAYREGLTAGDFALAKQSLAVLKQGNVAPPDGDAFLLADALAHGDTAGVSTALKQIEGGPLAFMVPVIRAWLALNHGKGYAAAMLKPDSISNPLGRHFAEEHKALLLIAQGKTDAGMLALQPLLAADRGNLDLRLNATELLAAKGQHDAARAILAGDDPQMVGLRAHLPKPAKVDAAFGIARLYGELAGSLEDDRLLPLVVTLDRSALLLDPHYDRARLSLASALSRDGDTALAEGLLNQISGDSAFYREAQEAHVSVLRRANQTDAALALSRKLADADNADVDDVRDYANFLASEERYKEAAAAYQRAIDMAGSDAGWSLYLQRGGALEQAGDWAQALPILQRVVQMAPDEPVALNYLGYAQVERGENLDEALKLLQRADKLRPGDPSITDSLAWAYYKRGEYGKALPLLEKASQDSPASVTINDHLGDTYWRTGRYFEARYAWRAAAVFSDGEEATQLADKIANGLPES